MQAPAFVIKQLYVVGKSLENAQPQPQKRQDQKMIQFLAVICPLGVEFARVQEASW